MRLRLPRLVPTRVLSEVHFAFGGALIAAAAGLALAAVGLLLEPHGVPPADALFSHYRRLATGGGMGWVGGLLWCGLLALNARRHRPPPPASALMRATWFAAAASVLTEAAALVSGLPAPWAVLAALLVGTLAARRWVAVAARRGA